MKKTALLILALLIQTTAQAAGDAEAGKAVFTRLCSGCHKIGPSARSAFGPPLNGIIDRPAAQYPDYKYTPEMQASGIVWTREKISAFVKDPSEIVPGTRMKLWWMGNDQRMEDLLEYLNANK
ncbi:c-type cytochrome [Pseudomonas lijiangensis]|uniref:C-type cytochrome n=1 Tax=Pseudomonas lijiangensis TaxID=2995658 RepID=A0ABX8HW16_9PSED|nr:c-type cytochrome [Pseudomonas lijiangensis]MBX8502726.1 c-type cytochrome [Pseudomonas lijiangensis]MBX8507673.1 c-type cytochrome [Pseudomonas lijiangensis]QWU84749.1 c-type cytochrome [Pseudomonas lijiangensis]